MKNVAIIGLGWLGMPLAEHLSAKNWQVKGTKRQLPAEPLSIPVIPFQLSADFVMNDELENLFAVNALVLNIPPNTLSAEDYIEGIKRLVSQAILQNVKHIVFVSSSGVFPQCSGVFTESSSCALDNPTAQLEQWLQQQEIDCDILRLAGLVGKNRHPVFYLAGKKNLTGANQVVNLVHQKDCIRAIELLLNTPNGQRIFHLSAPVHPTRQAYYSTMAEKFGLADLHFLADNAPLDRIISGEKICQELGFEYEFADPYQMPID